MKRPLERFGTTTETVRGGRRLAAATVTAALLVPAASHAGLRAVGWTNISPKPAPTTIAGIATAEPMHSAPLADASSGLHAANGTFDAKLLPENAASLQYDKPVRADVEATTTSTDSDTKSTLERWVQRFVALFE